MNSIKLVGAIGFEPTFPMTKIGGIDQTSLRADKNGQGGEFCNLGFHAPDVALYF